MGIPMESIYNLATPSGDRSDRPTENTDRPKPPPTPAESRRSVLELINERDVVETRLKTLGSVLDSHGVTMETPLLTPDGFPRDDLDIVQIRTTRAQVIRLRNDYKAISARIEEGLHTYHSVMQDHPLIANTIPGGNDDERTPARPPDVIETPFAQVQSMVAGGPAEEAGLKVGDRIRRIGDVNWVNHDRLNEVAETVRRHEGRRLRVKLLRKGVDGQADEDLILDLLPHRGWGASGLLGCHLVPL